MLKTVLLMITFLHWKTLACDCDFCKEYTSVEIGQDVNFHSDIIQHGEDAVINNENNPNDSENYPNLIYIYNLLLYYWELLRSYRNHIQYVQSVLNFREYIGDTVEEHSLMHLPNSYSSMKPVDDSPKINSIPKNDNTALKSLETTKEVDDNSPQSPNCDAPNKDENVKDTIARLRLVGLSFLDMGHLLLQDDPHYPIIPRRNVKNVEYIYPHADGS